MNRVVSKRIIKQILKPRPKKVHKLTVGRVFIIAGSKNMSGAGILTVRGALRAGAGKVKIAYPDCLTNVYRKVMIEALHLPLPSSQKGILAKGGFSKIIREAFSFNVVALGPGLSIFNNKQERFFLVRLIKDIDLPLVLDADGLNNLAFSKKVKSTFEKRNFLTIITPHEGEMSRLTGLTVKYIRNNRKKVARKYAQLWQIIVALKGYHTIIASPQGRIIINKTGGPALATAGTGDVLTGIIATLVAQNLKKPFEATAVAVYLHGLAGDLAAKKLGERSVIASDLIKYLPKALTLSAK